MRIGLDLDDVLFPWTHLIHRYCEGAGITSGARITQWSFHDDYGVSSEDLWVVIDRAYREGLLRHSEPVPGAVELIRDLQEAGHTIHLVTARGFSESNGAGVRSDTIDWLAAFGIPHDSLTFSKDKTVVGTDVFLDDSIKNVEALHAAGMKAWLHDAPHNQSAQHLPRVYSLRHFVDVAVNDSLASVDPIV